MNSSKQFLLLAILYALSINIKAQDFFQKLIFSDYSITPVKMIRTSDKGFVIVGTAKDTITPFRNFGIIMGFDSSSNLQWNKSYKNKNASFPVNFGDIKETSDHGFIVAGDQNIGGAFLLKVDSAGGFQWMNFYDIDYYHNGMVVDEDENGNFFFSGKTEMIGTISSRFFVARTDKNGNPKWCGLYSSAAYSVFHPKRILFLNDGNLLVFGNGDLGDPGPYLVKLDSAGSLLWQHAVILTGGSASDIALLPDSTLMISASTPYNSMSTIALIKTDTTGKPFWAYQYYTGLPLGSTSISMIDQKTFYLSGILFTNKYYHNAVMAIADTAGSLLWSKANMIRGYGYGDGINMLPLDNNGFEMLASVPTGMLLARRDTAVDQCKDSSLTLSRRTFSAPFTSYSANTNQFIVPTKSTIKDSSITFRISDYCLTTTISEQMGADDISVFPNPTTGVINVYSEKNITGGRIILYDALGEMVYSERIDGHRKTIDCNPAKGFYFLQLSEGNEVWNKKVIVE